MTVYVDNMRARVKINRFYANWSHLFADSTDELKDFADKLELKSEWMQHPGTHREHYDVTDSVRTRAVKLGAIEITYPRDTGNLMLARRVSCKCKTLSSCTWSRL